MSIHDETWDRCPRCNGVLKTWHGNYHDSGGCLEYDNYHDWKQSKIYITKKDSFLDGGTHKYSFSDGMVIYEDHRLFSQTDGKYYFEYPSEKQRPLEKLSDKYEKLIKEYNKNEESE